MTDILESRAKAICRERCAVYGEPACFEVDGFKGFDSCSADARCVDLARATIAEDRS